MLLKLLGAPITGPVAGIGFILEQIAALAEREAMGTERLQEELLLLNLRLEQGEITEEEFAVQEAGIIERLRAARKRTQDNR
jgi:hypothetical protein